jgi:hypothetical protein
MSPSRRTQSQDDLDARLDEALEESFPTSDPPSLTQPGSRAPAPEPEPEPEPEKHVLLGRRLAPVLLLLAVAGFWIGIRQRRAANEATLEALRRRLHELTGT